MPAFYRIAACDARRGRHSRTIAAPGGRRARARQGFADSPARTPAADADKLCLGGAPIRRLT